AAVEETPPTRWWGPWTSARPRWRRRTPGPAAAPSCARTGALPRRCTRRSFELASSSRVPSLRSCYERPHPAPRDPTDRSPGAVILREPKRPEGSVLSAGADRTDPSQAQDDNGGQLALLRVSSA